VPSRVPPVICGVAARRGWPWLARVQSLTVAVAGERAPKVTVTLGDDLDGGPAGETLRFGVGGAAYEIDLSAENAAAFRQHLAPFAEHARTAGRAQPRRPARTAVSRQRSGVIRAWAKDHGTAVSERGRIPATVVEHYQAADRDAGPATTRRPARTRRGARS
jgi:hypothetical protein